MEGCADDEVVGTLQSTGRSVLHAVPSGSQIGTKVDQVLAVACAVSFAASLVEPARNSSWCHTDGETPFLASLFECDPR